MADPLIFVPPPPRKPRKGGIKAVIGDFTRLERMGAAANVQYVSEGCGFPSLAPGLCWGNVNVPGPKTAEGLPVNLGITSIFGQYVGVECFIEVNSEREYGERATRLLLASEEHEVEAALVGWANAGASAGTGVGVTNAIAAADEWADQKYSALPVIIMSRSNAVKAGAAGAIFGDFESGKMFTPNGTPILATWTAPEDEIYVIGWPTVYASDVGTATVKDLTTNVEMAIAERLYGIAVDCDFRAQVGITATAQQDPGEDPDEELTILLGSIPSSPIPDGADATIIAQTNVTPQNEVYLWYSVNGGADVLAGEMTQANPHEYVWQVIGDSTTTGDSVEVWAVSEWDSADVESNHITIEVT